MGYTHYWRLKEKHKPSLEKWKEATIEIEASLDESVVCWDSDRPLSPPQIDDEQVVFNGKRSDGHETFCINRNDTGFHFCKTARKPYDYYVVKTLKILKNHFPKWIELDSGGENVFD